MGRSGGCGTGSDACSAVKVCSPRWRPWYRGTCGISVVASLVAERLVAFRFDTRRAGCDSSTLEYRTAELADETADLSHTPCVMCVMAATRRSDARTEVSEVTQHRNVMRTSCASAASAERCRTGSPRGGSRRAPTGVQGPRGPRATQPRSCAARAPRGGTWGCGVRRICDRGTHTSTESDCSTSTLDGGAVGRGVWGVGADARDGGRRERGPCRAHGTVDTGIRPGEGFGRHGTSECDNVAVALGTLFAYCLL